MTGGVHPFPRSLLADTQPLFLPLRRSNTVSAQLNQSLNSGEGVNDLALVTVRDGDKAEVLF